MKTWSTGPIPEKADAEVRLELPAKCFVGLYVCSHDNKVLETAYFSSIMFVK